LTDKQHNILIFDGLCYLCNAFVRFILKWDKHKSISFLYFQSEKSAILLGDNPTIDPSKSVIFIKDTEVLTKSDAVLEILSLLPLWKNLYFFRFIPKSFRDSLYDLVAKYRYKLFGKMETCSIPNHSTKDRFI